MALTVAQFVEVTRRREPVTITHHTGRYRTFIHAAYGYGYAGVSKTLCGRRFYDPLPEAQGWETVDCSRCVEAIAHREAAR